MYSQHSTSQPSFSSYPSFSSQPKPYNASSFKQEARPSQQREPSVNPGPSSNSYDNKICPICLSNPKDMAFGCGHQTCCECGEDLELCPICRSSIQTRIKLY
ncbi:unnamed protein product [Rhodiola kirilowii]